MNTVSKRTKTAGKIDTLMEHAGAALAEGDYFGAESSALEALDLAHASQDWDRMARLLLPLEEARRQRRLEAAEAGVAGRVDSVEALQEIDPITPGCWLLEPMTVGAHGRDFRAAADAQRVPVVVIVREPETQLGAWPIAILGPVVVRTKVEPPETLDVAWFLAAAEALGDEAIENVPADLEPETRINRLMDRLGAIRDHDELHQALAEACRDAVRASAPA